VGCLLRGPKPPNYIGVNSRPKLATAYPQKNVWIPCNSQIWDLSSTTWPESNIRVELIVMNQCFPLHDFMKKGQDGWLPEFEQFSFKPTDPKWILKVQGCPGDQTYSPEKERSLESLPRKRESVTQKSLQFVYHLLYKRWEWLSSWINSLWMIEVLRSDQFHQRNQN